MSVEPVDYTESICFHGMLEQMQMLRSMNRPFFLSLIWFWFLPCFRLGDTIMFILHPIRLRIWILFESESGCIKIHQRVWKTAKNSMSNSSTRTKQTAEIYLQDFRWTVLDFREFSTLKKIRQTAKLFAFILSRSTVTDGIMETAC